MSLKIFLMVTLAASVISHPQYGSYIPPPPPPPAPPPAPAPLPVSVPKYDFDWIVRDSESSNDFGHKEQRDGDNTKGSYSVLLPDGRIQTVTYYVTGNSGFVAEVRYENPKPQPPPRPSYGYP